MSNQYHKTDWFYCQSDVEGRGICDKQCDHCAIPYKKAKSDGAPQKDISEEALPYAADKIKDVSEGDIIMSAAKREGIIGGPVLSAFYAGWENCRTYFAPLSEQKSAKDLFTYKMYLTGRDENGKDVDYDYMIELFGAYASTKQEVLEANLEILEIGLRQQKRYIKHLEQELASSKQPSGDVEHLNKMWTYAEENWERAAKRLEALECVIKDAIPYLEKNDAQSALKYLKGNHGV
jgi:hypothetical protein